MTEQYDMNKKYYENHPAADIFPMMDPTTFFDLVEDIRVNGQIEPIVLCNDLVLDGRNRYAACVHLGIEPKFREYQGDPEKVVDYVVSLNLKRRHLDTSQRAMVAAKIATLPKGVRSDRVDVEISTSTQTDAAKQMNVSRESVIHARKVINEGAPELVAACEAGEIPVSTAASMVSKPVEEQQAVVSMVKSGMEPKSALRELAKVEQAARREELRRNPLHPPSGLYDVVVIDPPWEMEKIERDVRPNQHTLDYPCMSVEEIKAMDLPLKESAHVFLWTTHKHLPTAFEILAHWGLRYVCAFTWHKPGGFQPVGLPQYNCEFALYARKGAPSFVDTKQFNLCFNAPRHEHSAKPEEFYEVIRRVTDGERLDMFNRRRIDGFDGWGAQAHGMD